MPGLTMFGLTKGAMHGKFESEDAKEAAADQGQTFAAHEAAQARMVGPEIQRKANATVD
jgi:hypothetical protein